MNDVLNHIKRLVRHKRTASPLGAQQPTDPGTNGTNAPENWREDEAEEVKELRLQAHGLIDFMSERALDAFAECELKFDYVLRRRRAQSVPTRDRIVERVVLTALGHLFSLPADQRGHAELDIVLGASWKRTPADEWPLGAERIEVMQDARRLLLAYLDDFDTDATVTATDQELPIWLADARLHVATKVARVILDEFSDELELVAYDFSPTKGSNRFDTSNDPVFWARVLAATDCLHLPVTRVRNQFVRLGEEVVWHLSPGDVDRIRVQLEDLGLRIRLSGEPEASPGTWCADCGYRLTCPASDRISLADLKSVSRPLLT